ncbi:cation:proton antiporter domain-containing protein [Lysobacter capsici]|uniref:cation:proton antiporter domain-containing protein n=1 Tax=Lysobacter capsici TaxID=435897 RepID=UPI00398CDD8A
MSLFETLVILLLVSALLLQLARRLRLPYPALLALAGVLVAMSPWAPKIAIDPHLALVLFIAPALLSAAYDTSPYELRRHWPQLLALAVIAVLLTTAAVAWLGWSVGGLPLAAAIALGAIVAPPDAAAPRPFLPAKACLDAQ